MNNHRSAYISLNWSWRQLAVWRILSHLLTVSASHTLTKSLFNLGNLLYPPIRRFLVWSFGSRLDRSCMSGALKHTKVQLVSWRLGLWVSWLIQWQWHKSLRWWLKSRGFSNDCLRIHCSYKSLPSISCQILTVPASPKTHQPLSPCGRPNATHQIHSID